MTSTKHIYYSKASIKIRIQSKQGKRTSLIVCSYQISMWCHCRVKGKCKCQLSTYPTISNEICIISNLKGELLKKSCVKPQHCSDYHLNDFLSQVLFQIVMLTVGKCVGKI